MPWNCFRAEDPARRTSKELEKKIKEWSKYYNDTIKILLLGAGESGKTTILKQMKILHENGFTESERQEKAIEIRRNLLQALLEIVDVMPKLQPAATLENPDNQKSIDYIMQLKSDSIAEFSDEFYDHAESLWSDSGIQDCLTRAHEFPIIDSTKYFFSKIEEVKQPTYIPSDDDILHSRKRTSEISKIEFSISIAKQYGGGTKRFWMFDVGGQRGERKKWIQVFEGITAILFLVSCNNFDAHIREDLETNAIAESLDLFEKIWLSRFLKSAGIILFLNKQDLLKKKVESGISIGTYFEDYNNYQINLKKDKHMNPNDEFDRTRCYIKDKFLEITKKQTIDNNSVSYEIEQKERTCYWHFTTATDTENIRRVFEDVHSMVIRKHLESISIL